MSTLVVAPRASTILYATLQSNPDPRPVLLPAACCEAIPLCLRLARRRFQTVDLDPDTLEIDVEKCIATMRAYPGGPSAVIVVRPYGAIADPHVLLRLRHSFPGVLLVDDRCLARPELDAQRLDPEADLTLYSTGPRKYLDLGAGGFGFVSNRISYRRVDPPHDFDEKAVELLELSLREARKQARPYKGDGGGWLKVKWDKGEEQYLRSIEEHLPAIDAHKSSLNAIYRELIPADWALASNYHQWRYTLRLAHRDSALHEIFSRGLFASAHYQVLPPLFGHGRPRVAESLSRDVLNLFNDGHFTEAMARRCARAVIDAARC